MNKLPYPSPAPLLTDVSAPAPQSQALTPPEPRDWVYQGDQALVANKSQITFEGVEQIDSDIDFGFRLRGHSFNPLLDAATPLFGLVIRARRMTDHRQIPQLYVRVRDEIALILEELKQTGYDGPTQLAYSYYLCAFVDEAIMATPWGAYSVWAERSMLSHYHDETGGGEKFFTILSRMLLEPEQYQDMLALGYYCLSLGFRGKYGLQFDGAAQLQTIMRKLHETLRQLRGEPAEGLQHNPESVQPTAYQFKRHTALSRYWLLCGLILLVGYFLYQSKLSALSTEVLSQLSQILT